MCWLVFIRHEEVTVTSNGIGRSAWCGCVDRILHAWLIKLSKPGQIEEMGWERERRWDERGERGRNTVCICVEANLLLHTGCGRILFFSRCIYNSQYTLQRSIRRRLRSWLWLCVIYLQWCTYRNTWHIQELKYTTEQGDTLGWALYSHTVIFFDVFSLRFIVHFHIVHFTMKNMFFYVCM